MITTTATRVLFTGNGVTTAFAVNFKFLANSHLKVYLNTSNGGDVLQTITTHYTVTGAGDDAGGTVTFVTAPTASQIVTIKRVTTATQEVDYIKQDNFPADTHENALDRLTMLIQEAANIVIETTGRALIYPISETTATSNVLPSLTDRASRTFLFDENGEPTAGTVIDGAVASDATLGGGSPSGIIAPSQSAVQTYTAAQLAAFLIDEDSFATDSATRVPSQQSTKAYIAAQIAAGSGIYNYFNGIDLSHAADTDHDISFAVGKCMNTTGTLLINNSSAFVKQIDAVWAAGTNAGGRASAVSLSNATWYHCHIIAKTDGTRDFGFDTSITATNLLADSLSAGYTLYRHVGSVLTNGSANIISFIQSGNRVVWNDNLNTHDFTTAANGLSAVTIRSPLGLSVLADIDMTFSQCFVKVVSGLCSNPTDYEPSSGYASTGITTGNRVTELTGVTSNIKYFLNNAGDNAVTGGCSGWTYLRNI